MHHFLSSEINKFKILNSWLFLDAEENFLNPGNKFHFLFMDVSTLYTEKFIFSSGFSTKRLYFEWDVTRAWGVERDGHFLFEHCFASRMKVRKQEPLYRVGNYVESSRDTIFLFFSFPCPPEAVELNHSYT